ncbi:MAG: S41 family peptidase, partial [bacterium]|nr:S41 family peptidase [bacterium]
GETSFGKGSVQKLEELGDGSSLKVTVANWLSPNGELIADKGLKPDIEVIMTDEDYNEERDPQLDKALEIIKSY